MSKAQTQIITNWLTRLPELAKAAHIKPSLVRLALIRLDGGGEELQFCVGGLDKRDQKHNYTALRRELESLPPVQGLPLLPVKRCSPSCGTHFSPGTLPTR